MVTEFKNKTSFEEFLKEIDNMPEYQIRIIMGIDYIDTPGNYKKEKKYYNGIEDYYDKNMSTIDMVLLKTYFNENVKRNIHNLQKGDIVYVDFPNPSFKQANGLKIVINLDEDTVDLCDINSKGEPSLFDDGRFMVGTTAKDNIGITKTNLKYILDGDTKLG